jgi:hypothetical protein
VEDVRAATFCSTEMKNLIECGYYNLSAEEQEKVLRHIWNAQNWS